MSFESSSSGDVGLAIERSRELLKDLPSRWVHTQAVAAKAERMADQLDLGEYDRRLLLSAAWYHNVGYAHLAVYGWHQLDGAHMLKQWGLADVAPLVAWNLSAPEEARLLGVSSDLVFLYKQPLGLVSDLLVHADMCTGPEGEDITYDQRLDDLRERRGDDSIPARAMSLAMPRLLRARSRVLQAMAAPL